MLATNELYKGAKKTVVSLIEEGYSPAIDYLESLDELSRKKMKNLMIRLADFGILHNEQFFRHLGDHIYEFKVHHPRNARIFCFFDHHFVVCTHGTDKPGRRLNIEKKKALEKKIRYFKQRSK
jgi:phage-related protein